jgi:anti-sigma-K factor RskA
VSSECGGNAAAYALGALDPREVVAFERHLQNCVVCRHELTEFEEIVDALPGAVHQLPAPRGLRRRVLAELRTQAHPSQERRRPRASRVLRPGVATAWVAALAVACAAVLVLVPGASTTRTIDARVFGSSGTAELRLSRGHAELIVGHMPQPAPGDIYEVWLQRPHGNPAPTSALFGVTAAGNGVVEVPGNLARVRAVMVTQEPAGGTTVPTGPAVIVAPLSAGGELPS